MIPSAGVLVLDCSHGNYILDVKKVHFLLWAGKLCMFGSTEINLWPPEQGFLMNILQEIYPSIIWWYKMSIVLLIWTVPTVVHEGSMILMWQFRPAGFLYVFFLKVALGVCFALKSWKEYLLLFTYLITLGKDM